uniref:Uncharacterized protein n=1 Tax=Rhizophora mucronata TaxID=61149 RepID=A0A2P2ISR4_RHIMU
MRFLEKYLSMGLTEIGSGLVLQLFNSCSSWRKWWWVFKKGPNAVVVLIRKCCEACEAGL